MKHQGFVNFDRAIDWGWFIWFEKPIFYVLDWLFKLVGNFGVAIILLTCIVRGLMFPIAQKQFASMAAMRAVQPKMKELQERHKDDKQKMQQELLKLYQKEKVNPLAGCLPILLQIPIFYALYKVLMLTIEMRHQPFIVLDQGSVGARSRDGAQPVRPVCTFTLPHFLGDRRAADPARHHHVSPVEAQPGADGPGAAAGLRDHAVDLDVHDGAVRGGPAALLDRSPTCSPSPQQKWLYSRHPGLDGSGMKRERHPPPDERARR